jgi:Mrp family chromosome partitioning ATPase/predicted Fe-Mo cluster-binding NifX family protein
MAQMDEKLRLRERMKRVRNKIVVLSGKGGVGKSTVAVNLALALASDGNDVGLLDVDIHGPSIPKLLNLESEVPAPREDGFEPVVSGKLKVMSLGFILPDQGGAVIWRGPMKAGAIKQLLTDTNWGNLDYLVVDSPPGTGDEPLSVIQLIEDVTGAVVVTTPQALAILDVRKSIGFCEKLNVPVLGIIENMSGFACPKCGEVTEIFKSGGGETLARETGVPFLGRIPLDPSMVDAADEGKPVVRFYMESPAAVAFRDVIKPIVKLGIKGKAWDKGGETGAVEEEPQAAKEGSRAGGSFAAADTESEEINHMRIAIPLADGLLSMHFGHCESFALIDVDESDKSIASKQIVNAPPHEPGLLPQWLHELGADVIITGGMGRRAQDLFSDQEISVVLGAPAEDPETIVKEYLAGTLETGDNICDH